MSWKPHSVGGRTGCNPNVLSRPLATCFTLQDAVPMSVKGNGSGVPALLHGDPGRSPCNLITVTFTTHFLWPRCLPMLSLCNLAAALRGRCRDYSFLQKNHREVKQLA